MVETIRSLLLYLTISERGTERIYESTLSQLKKRASTVNSRSFFIIAIGRTILKMPSP